MFAPWEIIHVELAGSLPTLPRKEETQGYYVVWWKHGIPVGYRLIRHHRLPMTASQLAVLVNDAHSVPNDGEPSLARNTQPIPSKRTSTLSVSVVVPTRDRPALLAQCLSSLQQMSLPPTEIVVVDNAPHSESTREVVARFPGIYYVPEPHAGLDVARNTGVRHTVGDIVAFTDDDVVVHPHWTRHLVAGFEDDPGVMAVTGLVLPAELETESQWLFERYWSFQRGYQRKTFDRRFFEETRQRGTPVWEIGAGANMAVRREAFSSVGLFDERLDAGAAGCSGDSEFWYRVLAEGGTCRYEPSAVVFHHHRKDGRSLKRQLYFYMRGHVAALLVQFERYRHWGNLRRLFLTLPMYYLKLLVRGAFHGFKHRYSTLLAEMAGCLSGIPFYLLHRRSGASTRISS